MKYKKAFPILQKLLKKFKFKEGLCNLGLCYRAFGDYENELGAYVLALQEDTPYLSHAPNEKLILDIYNNIGQHYSDGNEFEPALAAYHKVLETDSERYLTWMNLALLELKRCSSNMEGASWKVGWENYQARLLTKLAPPLTNDNRELDKWDCKTFYPDKSLILMKEQGIGDMLMWGRYIEPLKEKFARVVVQCKEDLEPLFQGTECQMSTLGIDYGAGISGVAAAFNDGAPIAADWLRGRFKPRDFGSGYNIGIVWAGNPDHPNDRNRSTELRRFHRFAEFGTLWAVVPGFKNTKPVKSLDIKNWEETGSAIAGLDLIISVDTSIINLVGSMGCEGWLLQPKHATDFRWGVGVEKSAWYDSIRIFENPNDWNVVFDNVYKALKERVCQTSVSLPV